MNNKEQAVAELIKDIRSRLKEIKFGHPQKDNKTIGICDDAITRTNDALALLQEECKTCGGTGKKYLVPLSIDETECSIPCPKCQTAPAGEFVKRWKGSVEYWKNHPDTIDDFEEAIIKALDIITALQACLDEIEKIACGEDQVQADGVYDDSDGLKWIYDKIQALKEK